MKTDLFLVVKKAAFEVMVTGEKRVEVRCPSMWIKERLEVNHYKTATFQCGYAKNAPRFTCVLHSWERKSAKLPLGPLVFSNGLTVPVNAGDYLIYLGEILTTKNLEK